MPCYYPLDAYRSSSRNEDTRKRSLVFTRSHGHADQRVQVACGRCLGCRLDYSRVWAIRCLHEATCHFQNCFITLTYNDDNMPRDMSLCYRDLQLFFKRVRRAGYNIRYYAAGEYGDLTARPHYHAIIFGYDFGLASDANVITPVHRSVDGHIVSASSALQALWPQGFSSVGAFSFNSAAYVARYVVKKVSGDAADDHYKGRVFERALMSRNPGIGADWIDRFKYDVYKDDKVLVNGKLVNPPRYYDNRVLSDKDLELVVLMRKHAAVKHAANNTLERLRVRDKVARAKVDFYLKRKLI